MVAITEDEIRRLAGYRGQAPVTSCYLDVDGSRHVRHADVVKAVEPVLRSAEQRHGGHPSVARDLVRIRELVHGGFDRSGVRGIAVFASSADDLWRVVELPVSVRTQVVVNHTPYVRQLEAVVDEYERFGVLLVDRQRARVLVYELGQLVDSDELLDPLPRGDDADHSVRRDRVDGHADALVHQHLRRAAEAAFRVYKEHGFERLLVGAPDEIWSEVEALLHPYLRDRLEARCSVAVGASDDEIRAAALVAEAEVERREEARLVERLRESAGAGNRGVAGLDDTLRALVERRVDTLLVSTGFSHAGWRCDRCAWIGRVGRLCPVCQSEMRGVDDVVEEAIEDALAQSCKVESCVNADLDVLGRIGALLRY